MVFPNLFIVGATRCGTTSLHEYLKNTNGIFMSDIKEPGFFSISLNRRKPIESEKDYLDLFDTNCKIIGESSTRYFMDRQSPELIKKSIPDAKIIIILRDPVERAFSSYLYYLRRNTCNSFSKTIEKSLQEKLTDDYLLHLIINGGFYLKQTKKFIELFGIENVKILMYENFFSQPEKYFSELLLFLKINSSLPKLLNKKFNEYKKPKNNISKFVLSFDDVLWNLGIKKFLKFLPSRKYLENLHLDSPEKPHMDINDRKRLIQIYKNDVDALREFLKMDLPWINFD